MGVGRLVALGLGADGVVLVEQHRPDQTGQQGQRQQSRELPRPARSDQHGDQRRDNQVAVAGVEQEVVVDLGRGEDGLYLVRAVPQLVVGQVEGGREGHQLDRDVPPARVVPAVFRRQTLCQDQQPGRHRSQEDVSGEERQELLARAEGQPPTLEHEGDDDHQTRRDQHAEQERPPEVQVSQPRPVEGQADPVGDTVEQQTHQLSVLMGWEVRRSQKGIRLIISS